MKYVLLCIVLVLTTVSVTTAQSTQPDPYPTILLCEEGAGCRHSPISGDLSYLDATLALGEPDVEDARVIFCSESGCDWGSISDEDIDLVFGGDGVPDGSKVMRFEESDTEPEGFDFTEDEAEPEGFDFTEDETEPEGFDFTEDELGVRNPVPLSGSWTAIHEAGTLDCPDVFSMDIPAGDEQNATITVAEDGSSFSALDLDPETPQMDMQRVSPGYYHAEMPIDTPEGSMVLMFDVGFFDPGLAVGMITGEMTTQGYNCTVKRGMLIIHESLDLLPDSDEDAEATS